MFLCFGISRGVWHCNVDFASCHLVWVNPGGLSTVPIELFSFMMHHARFVLDQVPHPVTH